MIMTIGLELCTIDWTAVSAIASGVMIIVTSVSIVCNNCQSKKNREQQKEILLHQFNNSRKASLISISSKLISELNSVRVKILCRKFATKEFEDELNHIITSLENTFQEFCLLVGHDLKEMDCIEKDIKELFHGYMDALIDIYIFSMTCSMDNTHVISVEKIQHCKEALGLFSPSLKEILLSSKTDATLDSIAIARLNIVSDTSVRVHNLIEPIIREIEQNNVI